jgi:hypothetical protein
MSISPASYIENRSIMQQNLHILNKELWHALIINGDTYNDW